jgi:hypothetical protein
MASPGRWRVVPFLLLGALAVASLAVAWSSSRPGAGVVGPEGVTIYDVPDFAATGSAGGQPVDGYLTCRRESQEVVKFHTHTLVTVYVNGRQERLPAGIGIRRPWLVEHYPTGTFLDVGPYDCMYWVHTHVADGIVHVEAPAMGVFTLGTLFDVWDQPLSATQAGPAQGPVTVFENGERFAGDPRGVPLRNHGVIQIDVGTVVPYVAHAFKVSGGCAEGATSCSSESPAG